MKISIITATFNSADFINHSLSSVQNQNHYDTQHIIIDAASTDGTLDILKAQKPSIAKIVSEPDNGIYDAMNKGIALAEGDIIGILNADDFYASSKVLSLVTEVFSAPEVDVCYGDLRYVDANDTSRTVRYWKSRNFYYRKFYWGWMPPHPTFFVRRSVYEQYGTFNLNLGSAADYELMLRFLVKHHLNAAYIPEVLVHMRTGGVSNASFGNRIKANKMDRLAWKVNGLKPYPWTLWAKPLRKLSQWVIR